MKKLLTVFLITGTLASAGGAVFYAGAAAGEDDKRMNRRDARTIVRDFRPVMNAEYQNECGACHMAYPPGLLPARSWERIMGGLADHFGDNAELAPETEAAIKAYLLANAAERADSRRAAKFLASIAANQTPIRITETRYFVRKHDEIPERMVTGNPQVKSFANCVTCHRNAEKGVFDDDDVRIPGYERAHF